MRMLALHVHLNFLDKIALMWWCFSKRSTCLDQGSEDTDGLAVDSKSDHTIFLCLNSLSWMQALQCHPCIGGLFSSISWISAAMMTYFDKWTIAEPLRTGLEHLPQKAFHLLLLLLLKLWTSVMQIAWAVLLDEDTYLVTPIIRGSSQQTPRSRTTELTQSWPQVHKQAWLRSRKPPRCKFSPSPSPTNNKLSRQLFWTVIFWGGYSSSKC